MSQLRQNPATKEWVIISKERAKRPEEFVSPPSAEENLPEYEPTCPFCPGNESMTPKEVLEFRSYGTLSGTPGWWIRIIPNKYAALSPEGDLSRHKESGFFRYMDGIGKHGIIIEAPQHNLHIAIMDQKQVEEIFLSYRESYLRLRQDPNFEIIIIFKNHGKAAGTSLVHPHSQVIAAPVTPTHIRYRLEKAMNYYDDEGTCVYCDMIREEKKAEARIVMETENFICFEPFAARSPFETYVLPKDHRSSFGVISADHTRELAYIMRIVLLKIHKSLNNPDYNFIISSSPLREPSEEYYHWHVRIVPRVSAVAGFEMGSGIYINTVLPEDAAEFLRNTSV